MWLSAFTQFNVEVMNVVAGDDQVALELVLRATHTGTLRTPAGDIPATGRSIEFPYCVIHQIKDGKLVREVGYGNAVTLMEQLGSMPQQSAATP